MKTSDFNYELPPELIAQTPIQRRDASRLLVLDKNTGAWQHRHFYDLPEYLRPGDCLILNNSRVLPARLLGHRLPGGGACEVLLLIDRGQKTWECLVRPGKRMRTGAKLSFGHGELTAEVVEELPGGNRLVRFDYEGIFLEVLEKLGKMPLPPYIKEELQDQERYQTVYSRVNGSAAAPTAGLHFTQELLERVTAMGVKLGYVTLHVGLGTFRPVKEDEIEGHEMHSEYCIIPQETADLINETRKNGGRVICVGTTSCRTIESWAAEDGTMTASAGWTDIFIYPGYRFKVMDALITNFHLPESTLIMLVSALAGREHVLSAYKEAVKELISKILNQNDDRRAELEGILSQTTPGTFERKRYEYSVEYCDKASELVYKVEHEFDLIERKYNKLIEQKTVFAKRALARIHYILQEGADDEDNIVKLINLIDKSDKTDEILGALRNRMKFTRQFYNVTDDSFPGRREKGRSEFVPFVIDDASAGEDDMADFVPKPLYTKKELQSFRDKNMRDGMFVTDEQTVESMEDLEKLLFLWQEETNERMGEDTVSLDGEITKNDGVSYSRLVISKSDSKREA